MSTVSRTSEKCRKCSNIKNCNNKRMEACALAELPKQDTNNLNTSFTGSLTMPISKPYTPVTIHMGEYGDIHTSMEEINEKITKSLSINPCYFNKP